MNSDVLNLYFNQSGLSLDYMQEKVSPQFEKFLSGDKSPSFNQLTKIAKLFDIPVGLLLLSKAIKKSKVNLNFRTINSEYHAEQSKELQDTINEMRSKQDFLREQIDYELDFIGHFSINDSPQQVVEYIRKILGLKIDYYRSVKKDTILNEIRSRINSAGIFVFFNGKYKDNNKRSLNVNEFRGFVLSDKKAPIIFINQKDTKNGQLFTLVHELVHLFIGDEEILGVQSKTKDYDQTEAFVNKVTAEILVPNSEFIKQTRKTTDIEELADHFKVSKYVIARRMFDNKFINKNEYNSLVSELTEKFNKFRNKNSQKSSGGNYNNNLKFRIDKIFFNYVDNALNNQQISYTDAYNIVGVGYKGYRTLKARR